MRAKTLRGAWLLVVWLALAPGVCWGQGPQYAPNDYFNIPAPIGSTRPEDGGLYLFGRYAMIRTTNPLKAQTLAIRGFVTSDGTFPLAVGGAAGRTVRQIININNFDPNTQTVIVDAFGNPVFTQVIGGNLFVLVQTTLPPTPGQVNETLPAGTFVGPGTKALDVAQLTGEDYYMPGSEIGIGWKFRDGSSLSLSWLYLTEAQYRAGATLAPPNNLVNDDLSNTFLFSPVFNFPPEFAGADFKVRPNVTTNPPVSAQVAFGIWNAASIMTIEFRQRVQQWDITYREPIYDTENYRLNGLVGPRFTWIWEKFKWTTTSLGTNPDGTVQSGPQFVGIFSNVTSNRMYGVHAGCEQEWYLGHGFAFHLLTEVALYLNSVKERAKYETAAKYYGFPENKRAKREWTIVPELKGAVGIMWYPTEAVQLYINYELWGLLNTLASRHPVDFDYANLAPKWAHMNRLFDGFRAGIAIWF